MLTGSWPPFPSHQCQDLGAVCGAHVAFWLCSVSCVFVLFVHLGALVGCACYLDVHSIAAASGDGSCDWCCPTCIQGRALYLKREKGAMKSGADWDCQIDSIDSVKVHAEYLVGNLSACSVMRMYR
jgi:hypothetical protein